MLKQKVTEGKLFVISIDLVVIDNGTWNLPNSLIEIFQGEPHYTHYSKYVYLKVCNIKDIITVYFLNLLFSMQLQIN